MGIMTIRMPEDTHERLKRLAEARGVSVNKLIEEMSTAALAEFDAETRFRIRTAQGRPAQGLKLLDKLDGAAGVVRGDRGRVARQPRRRYRVRPRG